MISGSIVALLTPFQQNQIDEQALRKLVTWHIEQGTDAIVPVGTTGESATLSADEHKQVISIVAEEVAGRIPVIAGAGSNNPAEAIEYSQHAAEVGADATLHVAGYYNKPSQAGLIEHFRWLHDETSLPLIVYNIPPRAIVDIAPETLATIAELPRVIGVKDATGDLNRPILESALINKAFSFLSGDDGTAVAYNANGGNGCISVTANIAPRLCQQLQKACASYDYKTALKIQKELMPLHTALFSEPSPTLGKYALSLLGMARPDCRLPMVAATDDGKQRIQQAMQKLQLI